MSFVLFRELDLDEVVVGFNEHVTTNIFMILSHGRLPFFDHNKKQCVVPRNIILHQYTLPSQQLHPVEVDSISNFIDKNPYKKYAKTFYTVNKRGEINNQKIISRTMRPGQKTTNLELIFDQTVTKFTMGISCNLKKPTQLGGVSCPVISTLEDLMNKISSTYPDSFIHLHQLSCRVGDINSLDKDSIIYENNLKTQYMFEEPGEPYWIFDTENEAEFFSNKM
jgi:hypothetical protein